MHTPRRRALLALLLAAVPIVVMAAGSPLTLTVEQPPISRAPRVELAHRLALFEAEGLWLARHHEPSLRAALDAWRRAIAAEDADAETYARLAEGSYLLAHGFLDARREEQIRTFAEGAALADRGLRALSPEFERRRLSGQPVDQAARDLDHRGAPLLYWWARNTIRRAHTDSLASVMRVRLPVTRVMQQVETSLPAYDHGGADRFLGVALAETPRFAGGDLVESRRAFDRALALAPDCLVNLLELARYYSVRAHDVALYRTTLGRIASLPATDAEDLFAKQAAQLMAASL